MNVIQTNFTFGNNMLPLNYNKVKLIILHHRGGNGDVESIHKYHLKLGWAGIGYHYYIRKDGKVYQGRSIKFVGSHCKGNNSCSIGVCLEGNFEKEQPTEAQLKSLFELISHIKKMYKNIYKVINHRDVFPTKCPVVDLAKMYYEHIKGGRSDGNNRC